MHWPVAFARGDDPFLKDEHGNPKTVEIDYIDVCRLLQFQIIANETI